MPSPHIVWYTKGLRNTASAISMIHAHPLGTPFSCIASHVQAENPVAGVAHDWFLEPTDIPDAEYAQWVLDTAKSRGVAMVVAQRRAGAVWERRADFARAGIRLSVPAAADVLHRLDRKDLFCADMDALGIPTSAHHAFTTLDDYDAARAALSQDPRVQAHGLCVKPVQGIYGSGFRILEEGCEMDRLMAINPLKISPQTFRAFLADSRQERAMLLMSLLPGVERSVDFLAHHGQFVSGVARVKHGPVQHVEVSGPSLAIAARLTQHYQLHGVCNLQTKEADGVPHVLEINPRMSGGFAMACAAGVAMPLWHLRLEFGLSVPADVPLAAPIAVRREEIVTTTPLGVPA